MTNYSLAPEERETVILMDDSTDLCTIYSHQQRVITKLRNNPAAKLIEEGRHGTTAFARFELPVKLLSFRSVTTKRTLTDEQRAALVTRLRKARRPATPAA